MKAQIKVIIPKGWKRVTKGDFKQGDRSLLGTPPNTVWESEFPIIWKHWAVCVDKKKHFVIRKIKR